MRKIKDTINLNIELYKNVIVKSHAYIVSYGDMTSPDSDIVVKCDLWHINGSGVRTVVTTKRINGCIVNLEEGIITDSRGNKLKMSNCGDVVESIREKVLAIGDAK